MILYQKEEFSRSKKYSRNAEKIFKMNCILIDISSEWKFFYFAGIGCQSFSDYAPLQNVSSSPTEVKLIRRYLVVLCVINKSSKNNVKVFLQTQLFRKPFVLTKY